VIAAGRGNPNPKEPTDSLSPGHERTLLPSDQRPFRKRQIESRGETHPEGSTGINEEHPFLREGFPHSPGES